MKNCLNENPCNQGYKNPCHDYKNPCQGVREDEVVIKQYIDECGRKVYPITTDSAVLLEDGSNLKEALQNYITYLNSIQEKLSNLKGDHSEYNEKFLDVIARIRILEKMQSNPYTFDITSIVSRLTALEAKSNLGCDAERIDECYTLCNLILVAINNINTQIQELFNQIGENCISDFSTPVVLEGKEITSDSNPTVENRRQILSYSGSDILVYNVTPGSTINIRVDIANSADWSSDSSYRKTVGRECELYQFYSQSLSKGYEGSQWLIEGVNGENFNATSKCAYDAASATYVTDAIVVPNNAKCVAVTRQHPTASGKTLNCNITVTLVNCPEEDEDTCWFEEWIGNLKNTYNTLLAVIDDTVKDVTFAGTSVVDSTTRIAALPPFISLHGYVRHNDLGHYNSGYFLTSDLNNYNVGDVGPRINRGVLLPKYKLYDYCLYPLADNSLTVYNAWSSSNAMFTLHPGATYITLASDLKKGILWCTAKLETVSGATSNQIVAFYDISSEKLKYNFKLRFKNQFGTSCRYAFYKTACPLTNSLPALETTEDDAISASTKIRNFVGRNNENLISCSSVCADLANESTEIILNNIPPTANTLCISFHVYGTGVVEKLNKVVSSTYDSGNLSLLAGEAITFKFDDVDALNLAKGSVTGLTVNENTEEFTLTLINETESTVTITSLTGSDHIIDYEFGDKIIEDNPESTSIIRGAAPIVLPENNTQYSTVKYFSNSNDSKPATFTLTPYVPFYEIDTARFMYVNESGKLYEC